jgi:DNA-binding NarL/FixJ family response regulator
MVFLSTEADPDIVRHALSDGTKGYVLKSDAAIELLAAMAAVLQGKHFVSRQLALEPA